MKTTSPTLELKEDVALHVRVGCQRIVKLYMNSSNNQNLEASKTVVEEERGMLQVLKRTKEKNFKGKSVSRRNT